MKTYFSYILLNSSQNEKYFRQQLWRYLREAKPYHQEMLQGRGTACAVSLCVCVCMCKFQSNDITGNFSTVCLPAFILGRLQIIVHEYRNIFPTEKHTRRQAILDVMPCWSVCTYHMLIYFAYDYRWLESLWTLLWDPWILLCSLLFFTGHLVN